MNEVARNKYECQARFSWRIALEQLPSLMWDWCLPPQLPHQVEALLQFKVAYSQGTAVWCQRRFYLYSPFLFRSIAVSAGGLWAPFPFGGAIKTKEDQIKTSSSKGQGSQRVSQSDCAERRRLFSSSVPQYMVPVKLLYSQLCMTAQDFSSLAIIDMHKTYVCSDLFLPCASCVYL